MSMPGGQGVRGKAVALPSNSDEFRRVKYLLQLSIPRDYGVRDLCVWHFSNASLAMRFERRITENRTQPMVTVPAWYNAKHLGDANSLENLNSRGFSFPANGEGMVFNTGNFALEELEDATAASSSAQGFVLSQLAIGRSFVVDDPSELQNRIPEEYDSLYLALSQSVSDSAAGCDYRHDYCVVDPSQALPMYFVQFILDPEGDFGDDQYANSSEYDMSNLNGIDGPMTPSIQKLYDRYDFFDPVLYTPVSVRDKMVGSHAAGEAAAHRLISIDDAYEAAVSESTKPDGLLENRLAELRSQLSAVDAKLREVNENSARIENMIYQTIQDALFKLQDETQSKMSALLAEEVELRRQLQYAEWIESYLDQKREMASPVAFLNSWKCHVQLRGDMCRLPLRTPQVLHSIRTDMQLVGGIQVVSEADLNSGDGLDTQPRSVLPPRNPPEVRRAAPLPHPAPTMPQANQPIPPQVNLDIQTARLQERQQSVASPASDSTMGSPMMSPGRPDMDIVWETATQQLQQQVNFAKSSPFLNSGLQTTAETKAPPAPEMTFMKGMASDKTPENLMQYSLTAEATRRMRQMNMTGKEGFNIASSAFSESKILGSADVAELRDLEKQFEDSDSEDDDRVSSGALRRKKKQQKSKLPVKVFSESHALFMCIPFSSRKKPPTTKLLYASWKLPQVRTIKALLSKMPFEEVEDEDEDGNIKVVKIMEPIQTVVVIKANGQVFGGYASQPWRSDGLTFGCAKCFLFSISKDIKIPFHGRQTLPPSELEDEDDGLGRLPSFAVLQSSNASMQFGVQDLVISNDFSKCSSNLEFTFGFGLTRGSEDAKTLLAGSEHFKIDEIELWGILED